jgi:hypothetical protein
VQFSIILTTLESNFWPRIYLRLIYSLIVSMHTDYFGYSVETSASALSSLIELKKLYYMIQSIRQSFLSRSPIGYTGSSRPRILNLLSTPSMLMEAMMVRAHQLFLSGTLLKRARFLKMGEILCYTLFLSRRLSPRKEPKALTILKSKLPFQFVLF